MHYFFSGSYRPFMMFNINTQDHSLYIIKKKQTNKIAIQINCNNMESRGNDLSLNVSITTLHQYTL